MLNPAPDIDAAGFAAARRADRIAAAKARLAAAEDSLAALQAARSRFSDHAAEIYADGGEAALKDCDWLEAIADRLVALVEELEPAFERLDVARDLTLYRGPTLSRVRSRFDAARMAGLAAEALSEAILSGPAAAVLAAAVRRLRP